MLPVVISGAISRFWVNLAFRLIAFGFLSFSFLDIQKFFKDDKDCKDNKDLKGFVLFLIVVPRP